MDIAQAKIHVHVLDNTCAKSEAFEIIRLALQGVLGGLQMHSTSKTFV